MAGRAKFRAVEAATRYHPVTTAISEAQAAAWLLDELHSGSLSCDLNVGPIPVQRDPAMPLPQEELHEWLTLMASDTLRAALARAKEAFTKSQAATPNGGGA